MSEETKSTGIGDSVEKLIAGALSSSNGGVFSVFAIIYGSFLKWGTTLQLQEFFNKFILLQDVNGSGNRIPCIIVGCLILFTIWQAFFYRGKVKELNRKNAELQDMVLRLQGPRPTLPAGRKMSASKSKK